MVLMVKPLLNIEGGVIRGPFILALLLCSKYSSVARISFLPVFRGRL